MYELKFLVLKCMSLESCFILAFIKSNIRYTPKISFHITYLHTSLILLYAGIHTRTVK